MNPAARPRIPELDAVRGLAAMAVVLYHYTTRYQEKVGHVTPPWFEVPFGHYGVELFFLLSGFVITMTLDHARTAREFVVARFARLFPGYWTGMACTLLLIGLLGAPYAGYAIGAGEVAWNTTMLQRYVPGCGNVDGAYWTLSIELVFYGLILGVYRGLGRHRVPWAIAGLLGTSLLLHGLTAGGTTGPFALRAARHLTLAEFGPYFAAGMLFYRRRTAPAPRPESWLLLGCLATVAVLRPWPDFLATLPCFLLFALLVQGRLRRLANRPLLFLGAVSYSLYVVHQNVGFLVIRHLEALGLGTMASILAAITTSLGLAAAITFLVERPLQHWLRQRLLPVQLRPMPALRLPGAVGVGAVRAGVAAVAAEKGGVGAARERSAVGVGSGEAGGGKAD